MVKLTFPSCIPGQAESIKSSLAIEIARIEETKLEIYTCRGKANRTILLVAYRVE